MYTTFMFVNNANEVISQTVSSTDVEIIKKFRLNFANRACHNQEFMQQAFSFFEYFMMPQPIQLI